MTETPVNLPWAARIEKPNLFDPPEIFGKLRDEQPLRAMTFVDGHVGWLATGYEVVRAILADPRFSIRRDKAHPPHELLARQAEGEPPLPGMFVQMDPPEHTRYRRLLVGAFTVRRMRTLETRIVDATRECLDAMERSGPPVDLIQALALPVPTLLICELLGIPAAGREEFHRLIDRSLDTTITPEQREAVGGELFSYFTPHIDSKRAAPTNDIYSHLVNDTDLTDQELAVLGILLFTAGFETTSSALGLGTLALLRHPDQADALRADPSLIDNAVEEVLRWPTGPAGMVRTATEDVHIAGQTIRAGQTVELLIGAANRDPAKFEHADQFDITRSARGQLSFGHGIHQCIGQQLARVELRTVLPELFHRFPTLKLTVPFEEVPLKENTPLFGVQSLPVGW
ncbi:cytochrome P450 [Nonomuraea sp. NPDC046802]|uniref:cytochrome P450 n=1 Tax=Nonomuraea sp. NPDC046802 TaxID=3154919 RepID=UPI0033C71D79